ncbi:MAG TPA: apolipoprotein N-acyltransferase [Fimbriiglobus sp.]|jgi:apolipoprotein N-acyltransferase
MKLLVFLPPILSGLLLWTAFFPLDLGPVGFFALAPLLTLVRAEGVGAWRRFAAGYCGGLAFFIPALQWIRVADPAMYAAWIGLSLICALYWPIGIALLRRLDRLHKPLLCLTTPVVWVALEYFRAHFPTGFPFLKWIHCHQYVGFGWYFLGYTQHAFNLFIQAADVGGVYLISAAVASANGAAAEWLLRLPVVRRICNLPPRPPEVGFAREFIATAVAGFAVAAPFCYGLIRTQHPPFAAGPRVAAIQADVGQDAKMTNLDGLFERYNRLCLGVAARADLVVWPETCYPFEWWTIGPEPAAQAENPVLRNGPVSRAWVKYFATGEAVGIRKPDVEFAGPWKTNVLLGLNGYEWNGKRVVPSNTAILVDRDGDAQGRYDKMHLVPFGEYVPFRETFPWLQKFTPYKHDYSCRPGETFTRFPLAVGDRQYTFGVLICYEDSDPQLARRYAEPVGDEKPVDFLVNISNDGWFKGTEEHEGHLAICQFRAVEARRSVIRAVNMGISAVIDPDGKVVDLPAGTWATSKKMDGYVIQKVPIDTRGSYYADFGDWLPGTCWGLIAIGWIASRRKRS